MIHVMITLPDEVNMSLWPFAIYYLAYLRNNIPCGNTMMSPEELLYYLKSDNQDLQSVKVF